MIHIPNTDAINHMTAQELRAAHAHVLTALNTMHSEEERNQLLTALRHITAALHHKQPPSSFRR